jgi:hypothetical protein
MSSLCHAAVVVQFRKCIPPALSFRATFIGEESAPAGPFLHGLATSVAELQSKLDFPRVTRRQNVIEGR